METGRPFDGVVEAARVGRGPVDDARPGGGAVEAAHLGWAVAVVGVLALLAAAAGIWVPATHGTRTTAPVAVGGWVGAKVAMAVMAGLLAALLCWTAVRRLGVPVATAALAAGVLACSPPLAVYGSQIYPELPAALAVLAAVAALTSTGPPGRRATLVVGATVVALPWLG
jgi:hypothetical protein